MSTFKVLVLIALLGVLVNFLNDPLPDDLPGWWQTKLWLAMFRIVFVMVSDFVSVQSVYGYRQAFCGAWR